MKTWWQQLKSSEQRLVAMTSFVVVLFLFYSAVWQPLVTNTDKTQQKIVRQQALYTWVQENTQRYQQSQKRVATSASNASISSIVNSSAGRNNISIARLQPQGEDLQVWIDEVPFTQLLSWLEFLANNEGLLVKSIDLSKADRNGVVRVRRLQLGKG
ncbi:type II secretion system protein GspM [Colwellia hornerae]|uniref:Type II secretion system protein M n=1 Tax=Colwellia hornerae TaxID=89402 RepID=A0A5C6QG53_9GAMM|nr:type II secretion system protein M [Colwellia hornerae]TWX55230.1 type II secretion system protein M [Colwellia hornerae]TWX61230.1 type II secretion system protein M [Colwellia hornerae]TWX67723.1 type II secretion system protein M [Colwellia hornerae]